MWNPIQRTSGIRVPDPLRTLAVLSALLLSGCNYTFQAGAGFPPHVQTVAIVPFDNQTDRFEVTQELHRILLEELPSRFGLRTGGEEFAEAVVRGAVRQYSVEAGAYEPGASGNQTQVIQRSVRLSVEVQVVDRVNQVILWENSSLSAVGEFLEDTEREEDGRRLALERVSQAIVDGLQSNW